MLREVEKRFVDDAVVEKMLVVVAFVVVEFPLIVKFPTVEEAVRRMPRVVVGERAPFEISHDLPKRLKPRDEVEVRVYPDEAFPTRICPYVGRVESPVPP